MAMMTMKNNFVGWFYLLITFMVIGYACFAEDITTGNLLPNGTNNASNYQNVDTSIPNVTTNGFNTTGNIRNWGQELETTGTGGINVTGSLVGITTGDDTTTQDKLNNGVTLNSTTVVQNCEYQGSNWQCGQAKPGQDTYTTTVSILDESGNVLATVNQVRNNDAGYGSNAYKYSDTVIHTGTGSNQFYWAWEGVDLGYDTYGTNLGGPNLLGAKLTMTYDNIVLQTETIEEIEEVLDEFIRWEEEFIEPVIEPPTVVVLPPVFEEEFLEEFVLEEEPVVIETLEELEEEFEEIEILQVFGGPEIIEEPLESTNNEPEEVEPEIAQAIELEEEVMENEPTTTASTEVEETAPEPEVESTIAKEEVVEEEPVAQKEETIEEDVPTVTEEPEDIVAEKPKIKEFSVDVANVEAQVKTRVKSVEQQLQAVSIIAAKAMTKTQVNLGQYINKNNQMYDNRQIYENKTYKDVVLLDEYMVSIYANDNRVAQITMNDPVLKYQNDLREATFKRQQAERELKRLRGF